MPRNTLAPGFIRLRSACLINGIALEHIQLIGVFNPVWTPGAPTIQKKDSAQILWTTAIAALMVPLKPLFTDDTAWLGAEIFRQDAPGDEPLFFATTTLTDVGSVAGTAVSGGQAVFSFKGADDSAMRFTLLESNIAVDLNHDYAALTTARKALADYIIGSTSWLTTRGNSFPAAFSKMVSKQNDKLRKIRLLL